jgi:hypothetical protein
MRHFAVYFENGVISDFLSLKMPTNIEVSEGDVERIEEGNAGNKEYRRQCQRILGHFIAYKTETEKDDRDLSEIVKNEQEFEALVKRFFISVRVDDVQVDEMTGKRSKTGRKVYPTIGYMKNMKCTLFGSFSKQFQIDLTDLVKFPNHYEWWKKVLEDVKNSGRGTVTHKKELHHEFGERFMHLAHHLLEVYCALVKTSADFNVLFFRP